MSGTRSRKDFHLFAMLPQNNKTSTRREFFYFRESRREFYFRYSPRKVSSYEKYRDQTYCTVSAILFDNYQYYKERLLRNLLSFPFSISLAIGDDSSSYNGYGIHFWTSLGLGITWGGHHLGWEWSEEWNWWLRLHTSWSVYVMTLLLPLQVFVTDY